MTNLPSSFPTWQARLLLRAGGQMILTDEQISIITEDKIAIKAIRAAEPLIVRAVLERAANVCEKRAEVRFDEHGIRESDTGATYYAGTEKHELAARDEEDSDCADAIRRLSDELCGPKP